MGGGGGLVERARISEFILLRIQIKTNKKKNFGVGWVGVGGWCK